MVVDEHQLLRFIQYAAAKEEVFGFSLGKDGLLLFENDEVLVHVALAAFDFEFEFAKVFVEAGVEAAAVLASAVNVFNLTMQRRI